MLGLSNKQFDAYKYISLINHALVFYAVVQITKPRSLVRPNQSKFHPQIPLIGLGPIETALLGLD